MAARSNLQRWLPRASFDHSSVLLSFESVQANSARWYWSIENETARSAYQDDSYIVGKILAIARTWSLVKSTLQDAGHVFNAEKSEL